MKLVPPDESGIAAAVEALRDGRVVAYPTETVYGLAVDPTRAEAIERLFACKGRSDRNPVLVVVGLREQVSSVARDVPVSAELLMDCFWPGPLSLLLPRKTDLPLTLTAGADSICVRWDGASGCASVVPGLWWRTHVDISEPERGATGAGVGGTPVRWRGRWRGRRDPAAEQAVDGV